MQALVNTTLERLSFTLNDTFNNWCVTQASAIAPGIAVILGAYVQAIHRTFGKASFPMNLTLGPTECLAHIFKQVREVQLSLTEMWKQVKWAGPNLILGVGEDPGASFGQKVTDVREGMRGLVLEKYRPNATQLMDLSHLLFRDLPA